MTAAAILDLLRAEGRTLAVAESLTGGLLTDAFVRVPGASAVLRGGITAYATPLKASLLGVDAALLAEHGAVHPEVARQMADRVRSVLAVDGHAADVGLATTGVAGPDPQDGREVGTVFVAVALGIRTVGGRTQVAEAVLSGDRAAIRAAAVELAIATAYGALTE